MASTQTSIEPCVERFLQLRDVKARYLEAGAGYPTILLHGVGFTSSAEGWLPAIRAGLAERLHVIALDNIGWGAGDRPTFEYSLAYFVDFLRQVQDALGYAKTNLVGHSLGGWIAALFAYESPHRINRLVLESIAGMNPEPPAAVARFQPPSEDELRKRAQDLFEDPRDQQEQFEFQWRNARHPGSEDAYRQITKHLNDPVMRSRYYLGPRLHLIRVPTLVSWGSIGNDLFPLSAGQDIAARIPGADLKIVDGAGHFVPQQKPREWVANVEPFLGGG